MKEDYEEHKKYDLEKECPFCGSFGLKMEYDSFGTTVFCDDGCHGQFNFPCYMHEFVSMWNKNIKSKEKE